MTSLTFTVPGHPVPKQRPRIGPGGHVYTPKETTAWEHTVRIHALAALARKASPGFKLTCRPVSVTATFYTADAHKRDLDNLAKSALDPLNGLVWKDDSQVVELHAYAKLDLKRPRLEMTVTVLDD